MLDRFIDITNNSYLGGGRPGTSGMLINLDYHNEAEGQYYTVEVEIGSNEQPQGPDAPKDAPTSAFLIDLLNPGLYITESDIKHFKADGVYNPSESTSQQRVTWYDQTLIENGKQVTGYYMKDKFGVKLDDHPIATQVDDMEFFYIT